MPDVFLTPDSLASDYIKKLAKAHYESKYNPPRKMFDVYAAAALVCFMGSGDVSVNQLLMQQPVRQLFYSDQFGITLVTDKSTWEEALNCYVSQIDTQVTTMTWKYSAISGLYFESERKLSWVATSFCQKKNWWREHASRYASY